MRKVLLKNIQRVLNTRVVFCDPGAPYQKGLVENTNRIFRRFLPKRTSFKNLEQKLLDEITEYINSMKRKSLNYKSAEQVFKTKSCSTLDLTSQLKLLEIDCSPEQIHGRLNKEKGITVSTESIYQYIYSKPHLTIHLRNAKKKRKKRINRYYSRIILANNKKPNTVNKAIRDGLTEVVYKYCL